MQKIIKSRMQRNDSVTMQQSLKYIASTLQFKQKSSILNTELRMADFCFVISAALCSSKGGIYSENSGNRNTGF